MRTTLETFRQCCGKTALILSALTQVEPAGSPRLIVITLPADEKALKMLEGIMEVLWAFCWGAVGASGALVGVSLGLTTHLRHRTIAAFMSLAAGVLLSVASFKIASEALTLAGAAFTICGIIAGAGTFSIANAVLVTARDRKRCGECKPQLSEGQAPGSGTSIALGTALDAVPEALVLGVTLRAGGPDLPLVVALAFANVPGGPFRHVRNAPRLPLIYLYSGPVER
jgi:hypothetical protein